MKSSLNVKANQKGFTLIELVVVIVILGILAVTAAPKFIDLTSDAKASTVQAVQGALNSAADLAHAKALVEWSVNEPISIAGQNITFKNTYPTREGIALLMDIDTSSSNASFILDNTTDAGVASYTHADAVDADKCLATYTETDNKDVKPVITSNTDDC